MKKITMSAVALTAIMGSFSSVSAADGINILDNLQVQGEIRPRWENVDDGTIGLTAHKNANAYTARTKLKVTGQLLGVDGLSASVGIISVNNFGSHTYNLPGTIGTANAYKDGTKDYAVVNDPQAAMISNAEINYKVGDTTLHAGRGQVNLDNQRFIGTVGWRQLERSYDSVFVSNNSVKNLSVLAAWVYGAAGVGGTRTADANTVLLHAAYSVMPELKITAYDYMLAVSGAPNADEAGGSDTYGLALTGNVKMDAVKLNYRAEYAQQSDATMKIQDTTTAVNNGNFKADASYYNLDLGANISGILVGANYEFLSGQNINEAAGGKTAFQTPLATGHKFNGWADQFLSTPEGGLVDANIRLGYKAKGFGKLLAIYHDFTADKKMNVIGSDAGTATGTTDDLGSEIDVVYVNKIPGVNGLTGLLKYANYSKGKAEQGSTVNNDYKAWGNDTQKFWAQLDYKFSTK